MCQGEYLHANTYNLPSMPKAATGTFRFRPQTSQFTHCRPFYNLYNPFDIQ